MGSHFLLQGIFPTQRLNSCLFHRQVDFYHWTTREAHCPIINNYKNRRNIWNQLFFQILDNRQHRPVTLWPGKPMRRALALDCYLDTSFQDTRHRQNPVVSLSWGKEFWDTNKATFVGQNPGEERGTEGEISRHLQRSPFRLMTESWSSCLDETPETK